MENVKGIVLSCLPNIEWSSENLSGYGGTAVDGRWYYTYEHAMSISVY